MENTIKETLGSSIFIIIILLLVSLITILPVINMVILGAIIAYGIRPLANKLQSKLKFSSISIILTIILVVIPFIIIFAYAFSVIINFAYAFLSSNNSLATFDLNQTTEILYDYIPANMHTSASTFTTTITEFINDLLKMVFNYFIEFIKTLPMISLQIFVLVASIFYFARDGHRIKSHIISIIPESMQSFFFNMIEEIKRVLKSIFYGHFLTGVIIGIIAAIGFFILGYPYALFLGILTGFLQLIPIIGPWPVYMVLFIYDFTAGNYPRAIAILFFGFGLSLSDMYIRPTLSSKYADIHPMILLLGFLAGPIAFGLVGFILGPLILGITFAVANTYKKEKEKEKQLMVLFIR